MNEVKFNSFLLDCCVNGEDPKVLRVMLPQGDIVIDWSDATKMIVDCVNNEDVEVVATKAH